MNNTTLLDEIMNDYNNLYEKYKNYLEVVGEMPDYDTFAIIFKQEDLTKEWRKRKAQEVSQRYGMEDMN